MPRDTTVCQSYRGYLRGGAHQRCGQPYAAHTGAELACPDGSGKVWRVHRSHARVGQSFGEREVRVLDLMCRALLAGSLRGEGAALFARQHAQEVGQLAGKARAMAAQIARQTAAYEPPPRPPTDPVCVRTNAGVKCRRPLSAHVEPDGSGELLCPDGSGRTYLPHARMAKAARERAEAKSGVVVRLVAGAVTAAE